MGRPDHFDEKGIPVFTADSMFRPGENMYIHMSAQLSEYVGVPHKHAFLEIVYVISGSAIHETAGGSYTVSRGDVIVVNYDTPHAFYALEKEEPFNAYDLMFTPDFLDTSLIRVHDFEALCSSFLFYSLFPGQRAVGPDLHLNGSGYGEFGELFNRMYLEFTGRQRGYLSLLRAYVTELIIKLFRSMESDARQQISACQKEAVAAAVAYLRENYPSHITLEDLAMHIFLNKDYLNRIFREETGLPIKAFLQKLRVDEACRLLDNENMPVAQIAAVCGFGDMKTFYAAFKKQTGTTPGRYRVRAKPDGGKL